MDQNPSPPLFVPEWAKRVYQSKEIKMKHYIAMNGSIGCLPDNVEIYDTLEDAVEGIVSLFELRDDPPRDSDNKFIPWKRNLIEDRILYFQDSRGADYVEIIEEDCIGIENGCEYCDDGERNEVAATHTWRDYED